VPFGLEVFDEFFQLGMRSKIYDGIMQFFGIKPAELMIIGDNLINDFASAPEDSIKILVPAYEHVSDKFDFSQFKSLLIS